MQGPNIDSPKSILKLKGTESFYLLCVILVYPFVLIVYVSTKYVLSFAESRDINVWVPWIGFDFC